MGSNNGTGWPITFFCTKCRQRVGWRSTTSHRLGWRVERTGRTRLYSGGKRGVRGLDTFHEYRCLDCGHVGWSRHVDMNGKPMIGSTSKGERGRA